MPGFARPLLGQVAVAGLGQCAPPGGWETRVDNKQKPRQCWMLLMPARVSAAAVKPEDIS